MNQLQVILPPDQTEQIATYVHTTIMKAIEEVRNEVGLDKKFLKKGAMARWCGVSHSTFTSWCERGLPVIMLDGVQLYSKDQITNWLEQQAI